VSADRWDPELVPDEAGRTTRPEPTCPVEVALAAIAGRWTTLLLRDLMAGPRSYGQIRAALPTLSDKVLADRLRDLQERGLVERRVHPGFPTTTTYALTPAGRLLRPLLVELYRTGQALQSAHAGGHGDRPAPV
jgi:Predicted transcriptional regulators